MNKKADKFFFVLIFRVLNCCWISGLFSAGGMGLWHGVEFYENEKLNGEREFQRPQVNQPIQSLRYYSCSASKSHKGEYNLFRNLKKRK